MNADTPPPAGLCADDMLPEFLREEYKPKPPPPPSPEPTLRQLLNGIDARTDRIERTLGLLMARYDMDHPWPGKRGGR